VSTARAHNEPRLHQAIATEYGLAGLAADVTQLAKIADRWKPYRSWVALLLRTRAQDTAQPGPASQSGQGGVARPHRPHSRPRCQRSVALCGRVPGEWAAVY
jgi:hypothetical protein